MANTFGKLVKIMKRLRSKDGCPWDRAQTRESLKPFLVEEAYEVLEAIDGGSPEELKEELGDLLFQVIYHARIAEERGEFTIGDVLKTTRDKMIRRHPHVFGPHKASTAMEALVRWEETKRKEKDAGRSVLDGVPRAMPSLLRAHRIQSKASRIGFDWTDDGPVFRKVSEELVELKTAARHGKKREMEEEVGDLLFTLVNLSRFLDVNPEDALQKAIGRFITRFQHMEEFAQKSGKSLAETSLRKMERLWDKAKKRERIAKR